MTFPYKKTKPKPVTEIFFDLTAAEVVLYLHQIMHAFENSNRYIISNIIVEKTRVVQKDYKKTYRYSITVTYWTHRVTKPILLNDLKGLPTPPLTRSDKA